RSRGRRRPLRRSRGLSPRRWPGARTCWPAASMPVTPVPRRRRPLRSGGRPQPRCRACRSGSAPRSRKTSALSWRESPRAPLPNRRLLRRSRSPSSTTRTNTGTGRSTMSTDSLVGGRYRLERLLGDGGMASVHLARDEELDRPVAVKSLRAGLASDETFRERFIREARLAAGLSHPNVVQVFDAGRDEAGHPYIVMECVEGETLAAELARRGRLPLERTLSLGRQACAGLAHAHEAGLVHRDVKPHNLLVRPDGVLKVADFGIARAAANADLRQ